VRLQSSRAVIAAPRIRKVGANAAPAVLAESRQLSERCEALLVSHTVLVRRIAHHLFRRRAYVELDDLIQAGMVGLLVAIRAHDRHTGGPFEAYASLRIREAMLDFVRKSDWSVRCASEEPRSVEASYRTDGS
jgi:RNA polymerase sigma factor (sigma-70 family)